MGNKDAAMNDLYTLLNSRYSTGTYTQQTAATAGEALDIVLEERRKELFGEGHRLYDLIRTNTAIGTLKFITDKDKLLLPVPQQEIDIYNDPTNFSQNPGY